jgi:hypothetical protein
MLHLTYILDGTGWATVTLDDAGREISMTASYLHDSLGELAQAALLLRDGGTAATVVFMDEPGEHHLVLERVGVDDLRIQIRWFNDWASWEMYPADRFDTVLETHSTCQDFIAAVINVLDNVLNQWGIDGYKAKWVEHPFPIEKHGLLAGR